MLKKFTTLFLIFSFSFSLLAASPASSPHFHSVPSTLKNTVSTLLEYPEAKTLLQEALKDGPIQVSWGQFGKNPSHAMWDPNQRTIYLNSSHQRPEGKWMISILFELHNAVNTKRFIELDRLVRQGKLTKAQYIECVEWVEHQNALQAAQILDRAIANGYYPKESHWPIDPDFEKHFAIQKKTGHCTQIAASYDFLRATSFNTNS